MLKTSLTLLAAIAGVLTLSSGAASAAASPASADRNAQVARVIGEREGPIMFVGTRTRAEVRAEAIAAAKMRALDRGGSEGETMDEMFMSQRTRDQVRREAAAARPLATETRN